MSDAVAVVLAAGMGTRMKSDLPKVLCPLLGRPMIEFVLDSLAAAGVKRIIAVVGYRADDVRQALARRSNIEFALQEQRLGTGHAVQMAAPQLAGHTGPVLIVAGDSPLLQAASVEKLLAYYAEHRPACLLGTLHKPNPFGLGRIVRDDAGNFQGIVEEKDATEAQRQITEVNMSTYVFAGPELLHSLAQLRNDNRQREFYLTDCPGILRSEGKRVEALPVLAECEALSINTPEELALVEAAMRDLGYSGAS
ncbi:MAG: NTP transferase domain-containing protein [Pirellulaceae bacterium]|jgi:bifunctional UDP-N-acetylglucosamine pyrophosphorylase/glucosamine-1-phosphate N-acetyltransferase/UDP-N-acetylglucosamine pyrophosphorylase|nr:NTP transferase domain-containing protein [Pirellulaceae bacterium]